MNGEHSAYPTYKKLLSLLSLPETFHPHWYTQFGGQGLSVALFQ